MQEVWKDIEEYKGLYQVSNKGRIKSLARKIKAAKNGATREVKDRILKFNISKYGHKYVILSKFNKTKDSFCSKTVSINKLLKIYFGAENENI